MEDSIGNCERTFYPNGNLEHEAWIIDKEFHRVGGPAYRSWYESGQLEYEIWCLNGECHRVDGPVVQEWSQSGELNLETYYVNGKRIANLQRYLTRRGLIQ